MLIWFSILIVFVLLPTTIIIVSKTRLAKNIHDYQDKYYEKTTATCIKCKQDVDVTHEWTTWEYEVNGKKYHYRRATSGQGVYSFVGNKETVYYKKSNPRKRWEQKYSRISIFVVILIFILIIFGAYFLNQIFPLGDNGIFDDISK